MTKDQIGFYNELIVKSAYNVIVSVKHDSDSDPVDYKLTGFIKPDENGEVYLFYTDEVSYSGYNNFINSECCEYIKPYLRPMSSMTEEEKVEYCDLQDEFLYSSEYPVTDIYKLFDWLDERHFDYSKLIERGLALEVPEGMYK